MLLNLLLFIKIILLNYFCERLTPLELFRRFMSLKGMMESLNTLPNVPFRNLVTCIFTGIFQKNKTTRFSRLQGFKILELLIKDLHIIIKVIILVVMHILIHKD